MTIFMEAARLVMDAGHDVEFVIASQGSQQVMLRHRTQRLRIAERVTVADYPSLSAGFWRVLDIYCQPAVVASTGRTLIQAFGHAVPCIATDVKGLRDLINPGENGLIVPPRDPGALANAMITLLDHPGKPPAGRQGSRSGSRRCSTPTSRPIGSSTSIGARPSRRRTLTAHSVEPLFRRSASGRSPGNPPTRPQCSDLTPPAIAVR